MPTDQNAFIIELKFARDKHDGVYVSSDDVPGLHLQGRYALSMRPLIEAAITRLFRDNKGENVRVIWLSNVAAFPTIEDVPARLAVFQDKKAA